MAEVLQRIAKPERGDPANHPDLMFFCPGCKCGHGVWLSRWKWNGSMEKPTFTPSLLITGRSFTKAGQAEYDAWYAAGCPELNGKEFEFADSRCHTVITDGVIHFQSDCTHELRGKTVPLEPV